MAAFHKTVDLPDGPDEDTGDYAPFLNGHPMSMTVPFVPFDQQFQEQEMDLTSIWAGASAGIPLMPHDGLIMSDVPDPSNLPLSFRPTSEPAPFFKLRDIQVDHRLNHMNFDVSAANQEPQALVTSALTALPIPNARLMDSIEFDEADGRIFEASWNSKNPVLNPPKASKQAWEAMRAHIKRLYVTEDRTLEDVRLEMWNQYGHYGTCKAYKCRIKSWRFDKNNKEPEMQFMLSKYRRRKLLGKGTVFDVRGRSFTCSEIVRYYSRKGGLPELLNFDAPTPPGISYRSPSPIPRAPTPPSTFEDIEMIFHCISVYQDGSFASGNWVRTEEDEHCYALDDNTGELRTIIAIRTHCNAIVNLHQEKILHQVRRGLRILCENICNLKVCQEPMFILNILASLLRLLKSHLLIESRLVLRLLDSVAAKIFSDIKNHPVQLLLQKLNACGDCDLVELTLRCLYRMHDTFREHLGPYHITTLHVYADLMRFDDSFHMEDSRKLYLSVKSDLQNIENPGSQILPVMNFYANYLLIRGSFSELEEVAIEMQHIAPPMDYHYQDLSNYYVAVAQFHRGKFEEAENSFRLVLRDYQQRFGASHPLTIQWKAILIHCFVKFGMESKAKQLHDEIDEAIPRDDIDEQFEEMQRTEAALHKLKMNGHP